MEMYRDVETGFLYDSPDGLEDWEEVYPCDLCGGYATWDECSIRLGSRRTWYLCPDCRKTAIINLFESGALELGETEEAWIDEELDGGGWDGLKKLYKEAKYV